jgi:hypothetical protein
MTLSDIMNALQQASGFELYRLREAISRTLDDPKWNSVVRRELRIGQSVEYYDAKDNQLYRGTVLELRQKQVLILREDRAERWLMPYTSINLGGVDAKIRDSSSQGLSRHEVAVGDIVGFLDKQQQQRNGQVIRLNDKSVTLISQDQRWRVSYNLLHRVFDVESSGLEQVSSDT